jgi:4'-phosphopantetheinyl transferase EntD
MQAFLEENAQKFGFTYGIQNTAEVAARLEAEGDAFAARQLTKAEHDLFIQFQIPKRKVEWLAGRLAAKTAFSLLAQKNADWYPDDEISVLYEANGAPCIKKYPQVTLSISHSNEYALAVAAGFGIGVDIERIEARPKALEKYFFCAEEWHYLEKDCPRPAQKEAMVTWLWTRKEAVSKFLKLGGRLDFSRLNVIADRILLERPGRCEVRLISEDCVGYCISLAF